MSKKMAFLEHSLKRHNCEKKNQRVKHFKEFRIPLDEKALALQASRCMDCGIPFCHDACPVHNKIPDWNQLVYEEQWKDAATSLSQTNNFPEITGRICPAPCESGCTLNLRDVPVAIKDIECAIADHHLAHGGLEPLLSKVKHKEKVAVVGSGPSGLACAQQLARKGYTVDVYEKDASPGGLMRYGIPDFKLDKSHLDKRCYQMEQEGVTFQCSHRLGKDIFASNLQKKYDAVVLAIGSDVPRNLSVKGRHECEGIHFAMDFLTQQNRLQSKERWSGGEQISAKGKNVVVIGGGDTGSDCIGTAFRQEARKVVQLEITPKPPKQECKQSTWPLWPTKLRTSTSHEEGSLERFWSAMTQEFCHEKHSRTLSSLRVADVDHNFRPLGTQYSIPADIVFLAMGFVGSGKDQLSDLSLAYDARGLPASPKPFMTDETGIFVAGDFRRGQSLVVWAIHEGRSCAQAVDRFLRES